MDRVEEANEPIIYENDESVECEVESNFVDEWETNSCYSNPNQNHRF